MAEPAAPRSGRRGNGYPRQADIARLAGVSQATVSMVINDREGVRHRIGEETRRRVWEAVEQLGYVGNPAARVLAGGRSQVVGIYTFEPVFPVDFRDFYYPFLLGIEEEAEEQGYNLLLFTSASGDDRQRRIYRDGVNQLRVADGCVLLGRGGDRAELERLTREPFPIVFIGRRELGDQGCAYVGADYAAATAELVHHLADLGHDRVAYLGWSDTGEPTIDRRRGYEQARQERGWEPDEALVHQLPDTQISEGLVADLLDRGATAVIAQDDVVAERVMRLASSLGRSVPDDLSIVVLGDPPRGGPSAHDWTGFTIPRQEMGRRALRSLVSQLDDGPGAERRQLLLPCTLHHGSTAAPPPGR
jgi:DNA-binding LacI/PurR family transcriptional regulator